MELWFIFALVSMASAGITVLIQKIGVMRKYNSNLLNGFVYAGSTVIGLAITATLEGFEELSWTMLAIGLIGGVVYMLSSNFRMDSCYIDTTISLPLHKFFSPLIVLLIGIILFGEKMTSLEWIGITLGVLVPLILINQAENNRQNNLRKGVILIIISGTLSAIGVSFNKLGADLFTSIFLFATVSNMFSTIFGAIIYKRRNSNSENISLYIKNRKFLTLVLIGTLAQIISFTTFLFAISYGGLLAVVYTITSLYIMIPIVLSIIFYGEHWNMKKVVAIVLSILAVGLMG